MDFFLSANPSPNSPIKSRYLKSFFILLFSSCILHCNKPINSLSDLDVSSINIQSLQAINLSEDMNEVSTKEDEILLLVFLVDSKGALLQTEQNWDFKHTFKKRQEVINLDLEIDLKDIDLYRKQLLFLLVELDNEHFNTAINGIVKQAIEKESDLQKLNNLQFDKLLKHDDLLDIQWIELNNVNTGLLKFSGLQLFDKFEYLLKYKTNP